MRRPPLRGKTGCKQCRIRRKKCDEQKPKCIPCTRWGWECIWDDSRSAQAELPEVSDSTTYERAVCTNASKQEVFDHDDYPPKATLIARVSASKALSKRKLVFPDQQSFDMAVAYVDFYRVSTAPYSQGKSTEVPTIMSFVYTDKVLSSALGTLTSYCSFTSSGDRNLQLFSEKSYHRTVVCMRQALASDRSEDKNPFPMFIACLVLGYMEATTLGNLVSAANHFVAGMLFWRMAFRRYKFSQQALDVLCMVGVGHIYYIVKIAALIPYDSVRQIMAVIDWDEVDSAFRPPLRPRHLTCADARHQAFPISLYQLIMEMELASRQSHLSKFTYDAWGKRLVTMERAMIPYYASLPDNFAQVGHSSANLHFAAMRLLRHKLYYRATCSSDPVVRQLVSHAMGLIAQLHLWKAMTVKTIWPLIIVSCAIRDEDMLEGIATTSESFLFSSTMELFWKATLDAIRASRTDPACSMDQCRGSHDGLDLLLLRDGVLAGTQSLDISDKAVRSRYAPPKFPAWIWHKDSVLTA